MFFKKTASQGGLIAAYELNNKDDSSVDSSAAYEFFIKSTMVPENMRYQTIDGQVKIAGIDEEYCPFKYTSIYGVSNWGNGRNQYGGVHEKDDANTGGQIKCYGPGGTHHGVKLMTKANSMLPVVNACSRLCDAVSGCEAFWADLPTHQTRGTYHERTGRCCLKGKKTFTNANTRLYLKHSNNANGNGAWNREQIRGAYFVKVKNGKMGVRSYRKSY